MAKILDSFKEAEKHKDEMLPVDKWDGECWKTFFDQFCVEAGEQLGVSPWDVLADFINKAYGTEGDVLVPPCKVGDDVWWIDPDNDVVKCAKNDIKAIVYYGNNRYKVITKGGEAPEDIHTDWCMLSEEEANKRLLERNKK